MGEGCAGGPGPIAVGGATGAQQEEPAPVVAFGVIEAFWQPEEAAASVGWDQPLLLE
jgi:hypothetical protein